MFSVFYRVILEEPTIFSALDGEPNSAVSYDFVPGSVIRGLLIGELLPLLNPEEKENFATHPLFFSNDVLFLNATITISDENGQMYHTHPAPASWHKLKYAFDGNLYDRAFPQNQLTQKTTGINGYALTNEQASFVVTPKRVLNVHTQRRRRRSLEQLVYRYDALAKGQVFMGEIRCKAENDAQDIYALLQNVGRTAIGGARSAGYGQVWVEPLGDAPQPLVPQAVNTDQWVLTFLSDTILRDRTGNFVASTDTLMSALARTGITGTVEMALLSTRMVGGFNRKWGLPLPQMPAIKQGSVLKLTNVHYNFESVKSMLTSGLGERTNEGFGQLAINWQRAGELNYIEAVPAMASDTIDNYSKADSDTMTAFLTKQLELQRLDSNITGIVYGRESAQYELRGKITATQIARLRNIIRDELRQPNPQRSVIRTFLDKTIKGKIAAKQYDDARLGSVSLSRWLHDMLEDEMSDITLLNFIDVVLENAQKSARQQEQET